MGPYFPPPFMGGPPPFVGGPPPFGGPPFPPPFPPPFTAPADVPPVTPPKEYGQEDVQGCTIMNMKSFTVLTVNPSGPMPIYTAVKATPTPNSQKFLVDYKEQTLNGSQVFVITFTSNVPIGTSGQMAIASYPLGNSLMLSSPSSADTAFTASATHEHIGGSPMATTVRIWTQLNGTEYYWTSQPNGQITLAPADVNNISTQVWSIAPAFE